MRRARSSTGAAGGSFKTVRSLSCILTECIPWRISHLKITPICGYQGKYIPEYVYNFKVKKALSKMQNTKACVKRTDRPWLVQLSG